MTGNEYPFIINLAAPLYVRFKFGYSSTSFLTYSVSIISKIGCSIIFIFFLSPESVYGQFMNGVPTYFKTPYGHYLYDHGYAVKENCIRLPVSDAKWYFYNDRIIGTNGSSFFIMKEWQHEDNTYITNVKSEWEDQLIDQNLKPALWTKWYDMGDGFWGEELPELLNYWFFYLFAFISLIWSVSADYRSGKFTNTPTLILLLLIVRSCLYVSTVWLISI